MKLKLDSLSPLFVDWDLDPEAKMLSYVTLPVGELTCCCMLLLVDYFPFISHHHILQLQK
jgi:hypothetical protein